MQTKKQKASILVVTMMILGIVLVTALSISVVSIQERKASMGSNKSNQAYQVADTGIEKVMDAIVKNRTLSVSDLVGGSFGFSCSVNGANHAVLKKTGETYEVELKKTADADTTDCLATTKLSDIASIKSVGTNSGQQRAIEAAVAASAGYQTSCWSASNGKNCCRINMSTGETKCKNALNSTASWTDYSNNPSWTAGITMISCADANGSGGSPFVCCGTNGATGVVECKSGDTSGVWTDFTNKPW